MDTNTLETVLATVVPAVAVLFAWCVKLLTEFVKAKTTEIKTKTNNDTIKTYVDMVSDNALNVVETLNQTLVDGLKAASADGKLTQEEITEIKTQAVNMLADTLSDDAKEVLTKAFGDIEKYLDIVIQRAVCKVKKGNV